MTDSATVALEIAAKYATGGSGVRLAQEISAAIRAAQIDAREAWKDISSAPKTGARILAWNRLWSGPNTCQLYPRGWGPSCEEGLKYQPTHWIELPPVPNDPDASREET
jgi:hypothetical protein